MEVYCHYCGDPGTTLDHLYPRGWSGHYNTRSKTRTGVPTVPACRECNGILNDIHMPDPDERRAHVQERLKIRYKKTLATPNWSLEDLGELGPTMQAHICQTLLKKYGTLARLAWPDRADWMLDRELVRAVSDWAYLLHST